MSRRWGRWPDWAVALAGAFVLATSFFPWYQVEWVVGRFGFVTHHSFAADVWDASTSWSFAILLGVAAAGVFVAATLGLFPSRWTVPLRLAATALVVGGLVLAVWPWLAMHQPAHLQAILSPTGSGAPPPAIGTITRDALIVLHEPGFDADVTWGFPAGVIALTLELTAAATATTLAAKRGP